jgi:hypothetical protein
MKSKKDKATSLPQDDIFMPLSLATLPLAEDQFSDIGFQSSKKGRNVRSKGVKK